MVWCITGLFLVLTIIFLAGKGSFLIAGYNTAGKKEKARYDEKKLCRVMGGCMGVITAALAVTAWLGEDAPDYLRYGFIFVVFADIFVTAVLGNTVCLRKSTGEKSLEERRKNQKAMWFSMGILAVLFLIVGILLTTGNIKVNLTEEVMEIQGSYWPDLELSWDKIQSVSCAEGIQAGSRTGGLEVCGCRRGDSRMRNLEVTPATPT